MDDNILFELYLVRHGESLLNAGMGSGLDEDHFNDPPLSEKGIRQACLLGEYFSGLSFDHILSSGLRRAHRTAYEVASRQPDSGCRQIEVHKIFTECKTTSATRGRTIEELKSDYPNTVKAPGTESDERIVHHGDNDTEKDLFERAEKAMDYLRSRFKSGEKVLVAGHAAFNTNLLFAALGLDYVQIFDPSFFNTGITKIIFYKEGTGSFGDVHLEYHNAVPHLISEMKEFKY